MTPLDEVRFWSQVLGDSRQTVMCNPDLESRCKGYVAARGLDGLITVEASPFCPMDRIYVIDEGAMEASMRQGTQRAIRRLFP